MTDKCKHCGKSTAKYPLWEGEVRKSKFLWKNLFKMDWYSILLLLTIILILYGYNHDISQCHEVIENPCGFCERSRCCLLLEQEQTQVTPMYDNTITDIFNEGNS